MLPSTRNYIEVTTSITNQNYIAAGSLAPIVETSSQGANLLMSWHGFSGIDYQLYYTTNLLDWMPYGNPIHGSNSLLELDLPIETDTAKFFRLNLSKAGY